MFFTIENTDHMPIEYLKYIMLNRAYRYLHWYKPSGNDLVLEEYLKQTFGLKLKELCLLIVNNIKLYSNENDEVIIKIKDPRLDKIARIITYGTGKISGSRILQIVLTDKV